MDYKKLQNTSTVDILSHLYKDYRPKKRKDVYEVERLISKREGIEVSKQINIKFQLSCSLVSSRLVFVAWLLRIDLHLGKIKLPRATSEYPAAYLHLFERLNKRGV